MCVCVCVRALCQVPPARLRYHTAALEEERDREEEGRRGETHK